MVTECKVSIGELREVDVFAGLSDQDLEIIGELCDVRSYPAGERCAVQGEVIDELRIVHTGRVVVEMRVEAAPYTQTLTITTLSRGNVFAWSAIVEPHVLTASVRCLERTQVLCIKASELERVFRDRPLIERAVMKNLTAIISNRLKGSRSQLVQLVAEMIKQGK